MSEPDAIGYSRSPCERLIDVVIALAWLWSLLGFAVVIYGVWFA